MSDLMTDIELKAHKWKNHMGNYVRAISDMDLNHIAEIRHQTIREICIQSLKMGITPLRYLRNSPSISIEDQIILGESEVAVVGAGGLGGHVIQLLCRLGIGRLLVCDPDTFDQTNLNRQSLCFTHNQGMFKAEEAVRQCALINPAVEVKAHVLSITHSGQIALFSHTNVVIDALDNAKDRLILSSISKDLGIPMVHGAVAGFEGRVMTHFPGDTGMNTLYSSEKEGCAESPGAEHVLGTPALAPALIAPFQVMATVKILLNRGDMKHNCLLHVDLEKMSMNSFMV
ncbi:MAG: ThiF family adenylyltransferase [Proteobacteria bacterium]|nr:ThiF family adenylyltransferase [Pseudomonadota bacterium]